MSELRNNLKYEIDASIVTILKSGAIDLEQYENNFRLPKIVMTAIMLEMAYQYEPLGKKDNKEVKNIGLFL